MGGRFHRNEAGGRGQLAGGAFSVRTFEDAQSIGDLRPFPVKGRQPVFQIPNLVGDVVGVGDIILPFSIGSRSHAVRLACRHRRSGQSYKFLIKGQGLLYQRSVRVDWARSGQG